MTRARCGMKCVAGGRSCWTFGGVGLCGKTVSENAVHCCIVASIRQSVLYHTQKNIQAVTLCSFASASDYTNIQEIVVFQTLYSLYIRKAAKRNETHNW